MNILGLSAFYHDSAAALIVDGEVKFAAHEERYSRVKQDANFPHRSIMEILGAANIRTSDLDRIVWYEDPELKQARARKQILDNWPRSIDTFKRYLSNKYKSKKDIIEIIKSNYITDAEITFLTHHLSHAASAIFGMKGSGKSITLTADAVGEFQTATCYLFDYENWSEKPRLVWEMKYPSSLGLYYSAITQLLGFEVNEGEYKVMGLAPYGSPDLVRLLMHSAFRIGGDGYFYLQDGIVNWSSDSIAYGKKLAKLCSIPKPIASSEVMRFADVAASAQATLEKVVINILEKLVAAYKPNEIRLAGGVALNCTLNSKIARHFGLPLHIPPAAGDAGTSLGAALFTAYECGDLTRAKLSERFGLYLGTEPESENTRKLIFHRNMNKVRSVGHSSAIGVANLLAKENVVAVIRGRAEFGPRALGNRCILASPLTKQMKDHLNASIKFREQFRPFAPVTIAKYYDDYFEKLPGTPSELMLYTVKCLRPKEIPSVTHVDGTSRVQKLDYKDNNWLYEVIDEFGRITGTPVLILTSFNLKGEPIVQDTNDALSTFMRSGIDYLVTEENIYQKLN